MKLATALTFLGTVGAQMMMTPPEPQGERMDYEHENVPMRGFVAKPEGASASNPLPAVVIIPDWDGQNFYEQQRVTMVAQEYGYIGFAADIFGAETGEFIETTDERIALISQFYSNTTLFAGRIDAAIDVVKGMPEVDPDRVAVVGYCFGGTGVLAYGLNGYNNAKALVSVHGGLDNLDDNQVMTFGPELLVLSGGEDDRSTKIIELENTLDMANATWEITRYSDIMHAWTVFDNRNYNPWADMRTWERQTLFLQEQFGELEYETMRPGMDTTTEVSYIDETDNKELLSHVATPDMDVWEMPAAGYPAVVILPNWDGVNAYERERATMFAEMGYVGFAADIYGADLQEVEGDARGQNAGIYTGDVDLYNSRIMKAIATVKALPEVDPDNVALIGYCFGGTGVINFALDDMGNEVKVVGSYHGGLRTFPERMTTEISPYILILSGGIDFAWGNQTVMEETLDAGDAMWEISRWSNVQHGFTEWDSNAYNLRADYRSFTQLIGVLENYMPVPMMIEEEASGVSSMSAMAAIFMVIVALAF